MKKSLELNAIKIVDNVQEMKLAIMKEYAMIMIQFVKIHPILEKVV